MPKIVSLKDNNSTIKYPITVSDAIVDLASGKKLSEIIDSLFDYLYFEAIESSTIGFTKATGLTIDLKYKIDNGSWQDYSQEINITAGQKVYFKGDNEKISDLNYFSGFSITGKVIVGGNIMSLLGFRDVLTERAFYYLFSSCVGIYQADKLKLPATANYCYQGMFYGCTSLTTPPKLPATTLDNHCYEGMFWGCTSLVTPPTLPATTLAQNCYWGMFWGCTSLTTAPELPATILAQNCYCSMFQDCTSLTTAPTLPATTLASYCYYGMFQGCTSLVTPPTLPATTLASYCYYSMFQGCTSLTTAPSLLATTLASYCYYGMFQECTSLVTPPTLPATTLASYCYNSMFRECTSLITAPTLPATNLAQGCYVNMFRGCTSLTTAPELPALTLVSSCYNSMFYGCSNLSYIKALFTTTPSSSYTSNWVNGVAATGVFVKSPEAAWDVTNVNGVPSGWTVKTALPGNTQSKVYTNVLRKNSTYDSPYATSYFYFGQLKQIDLLRPSHIKYRVIAYTPGNGNYMLDSVVQWDFGYNGIYKSYCIYNNLSSTSYYPFGYHTLFRSNSAAITQSDGSYFGFYFGSTNGYGQSASTIARTIEVEILECYNCEATLIDSPICLVDVDYVPSNLKQTSASVAYNTSNFTAVNVSTAVGLQETGDANSDVVGYQIRTNSYSKPMKSALGYGYKLLFTSSDKLGWVPATNAATDNATAARTPATDPIDPFGEIVYYNGTAAVAAGSRPSATNLWEQYPIILGYSFNDTGASLTLTSWKPVYIKCTPQLDGSAIIEGYTQDLPTTEDERIYIYLGVAYSATNVELVIKHPVYYYKNGAVRLWTGEIQPHDYSQDYFTIEALEDGDVKFVFGSSVTTDDMTSMSYSSDDGNTWTLIENQNDKAEDLVTTISVTSGDCILWKGIGNTMFHASDYKMSHFESTNEVNVKGNIMSLVFGDNYKNQLSLQGRPYCFSYLFNDNYSSSLKIIDASNLSLPATTLDNYCYWEMFQDCTSLTAAPSLPATTLANFCYTNLFKGCTSLAVLPSLPAMTLATGCYFGMFSGCTSLTAAPEFPATTLVQSCYASMFSGCTSLTKTPELPATTLADGCYQNMFYGCTSLTKTPELPATTLTDNCYDSMFYGCTSLTTAPELPATTSAYRCYYNMFYNCTSLSKAPSKLPATTLTQSCYQYMFKGCTSLTTAPELLATTLAYSCCDSMFYGCTSLKTAPSILPATTLTYACYQSMFEGCTSLTIAPELPATTLSQICYNSMFADCSNLSYIKALFTTKPTSGYTLGWVYNVAASGVFIKNNNATWDVTGQQGIPTGWQVYSESEWKLARGYQLNQKQNTLVSGSTIKTINNESILGSGNINTSFVTFRQW